MGCVLWLSAMMAAFAFALALIWRISTVGKYWIKMISFGIISTISATVPIPIMLLRPRDPKNALIPAAGLRASCFLLGIKRTVEGHENIVKNNGCVVLINHQSVLDLIVLAELWPIMDNCTVISKKEIFYLQPFGLATWLWGTIFIDRVKKEKAQEAVNQRGKYIEQHKSRVLMFPEGTRSSGDKLLKFKKGAFHLAIASGCPIQPVAVSRYRFLGNQRFDDGHMKIKILPAISTEGYTTENIQELMDKCYEVMSENVDLLTKENETNLSNNNKIKAN